jgi:hypothetical protein
VNAVQLRIHSLVYDIEVRYSSHSDVDTHRSRSTPEELPQLQATEQSKLAATTSEK